MGAKIVKLSTVWAERTFTRLVLPFFQLQKFRNTALMLRLVQIAVATYGFISLACIALSYEISAARNQLHKFCNALLKHRLGLLDVCIYAFAFLARFA